MAEITMIRQGDSLRPASMKDLEVFKGIQHGKPLRCKITSMRNYEYHKRAFALLNLAFEYWVPESMVSDIEKKTVKELFKFLCANGIEKESTRALCGSFLTRLNANRSQLESVVRSFDVFRDWVAVEAGFFDVVICPSGPKKVARSISYANMDETVFHEYYKAIFDVCWRLCLGGEFDDIQSAENAAMELLTFA